MIQLSRNECCYFICSDGDLYAAAPFYSDGTLLQFRRKAGNRISVWMHDQWVSGWWNHTFSLKLLEENFLAFLGKLVFYVWTVFLIEDISKCPKRKVISDLRNLGQISLKWTHRSYSASYVILRMHLSSLYTFVWLSKSLLSKRKGAYSAAFFYSQTSAIKILPCDCFSLEAKVEVHWNE